MLKQGHLYLMIFCLCLLTVRTSGQVNDPVSILERSLSGNLNDTTRFNTLISLAGYYKSKKGTLTLAKKFLSEAFDLARKKNLKIPYTLYWANAEVYFIRNMYQHDKIATNNYLTKFSSLMRRTQAEIQRIH